MRRPAPRDFGRPGLLPHPPGSAFRNRSNARNWRGPLQQINRHIGQQSAQCRPLMDVQTRNPSMQVRPTARPLLRAPPQMPVRPQMQGPVRPQTGAPVRPQMGAPSRPLMPGSGRPQMQGIYRPPAHSAGRPPMRMHSPVRMTNEPNIRGAAQQTRPLSRCSSREVRIVFYLCFNSATILKLGVIHWNYFKFNIASMEIDSLAIYQVSLSINILISSLVVGVLMCETLNNPSK